MVGSGVAVGKLEIVHFPHPALRYESRPVTRVDHELRTVIREMFDLMYEAKGIGLAANQVGLPFRFFVLNLASDPNEKEQERVFLNPEILSAEGTLEEEEGCLSFPGIYAKVKRFKKVRFRSMDQTGRSIEGDATDLLSRAIQHESDHLAGKLFIDYLTADSKASVAAKIAEVESGFRTRQASGGFPSDVEISRQLVALAEANRLSLPGSNGSALG
jgi:peptide deformylase